MQPTKSIKILGIDQVGGEAAAIRTFAEELFLRVELYGIGENRDIPELLNEDRQSDLIVLVCHGDDGNIVTPQLDDSLRSRQPFWGHMNAEHIRDFLKLDGQRILNTGCSTGVEEMASAFLDAGCEWYVAPVDYPDGTAGFVFVVNFLYQLFGRGLSVEEALSIATREDDDSRFFRLYRR